MESNERLYALLDIIASDTWFKENHVLTVVGHNLPTNENRGILTRYPFVITVRGEGELAVRELVRFVRGEIPIDDIPAASYIRRGIIVENDGIPVSTLDIGVPSRDTLLEILAWGGDIMIETSRGCGWGQCAFCFKDPFRSHKWEPFSDEVVLDGLEYLQNMGAKHVILSDWEFFGGGISTEQGVRRAYRLAIKMKERGITKLRIAYALRADSVYDPKDSAELAELKVKTIKSLYEVGFIRAFLGLESGSDTQLQRYQKGITSRQNAEAVRIMREIGCQLSVGFIPIDPYATLDEIRENIKFLRDNNLFIEPAYPLNLLKVQPATMYYNWTLRDGLLGERQSNLHTFDVRYQNPDVQKIVDALQYIYEVGSVFYVLKYMYRTKFLNQITGDEEETALLRQLLEEYNRMEIDYLEALVEDVHDTQKLAGTIQEFRKKRLDLVAVVDKDIKQGRIKDENETLSREIDKIRPMFDDMAQTSSKPVDQGKDNGGATQFNLPGYRKIAALVETIKDRILPVAVLVGWQLWKQGDISSISIWGVLLVIMIIPFSFKFSHLLRGWDATFHNRDVTHITRLTAVSTLPLLLLPWNPFIALILYGLILIPLTYHHDRVDNPGGHDITGKVEELAATRSNEEVAQFIASLAGPLQQKLLERGFDFKGARAILNRRLVAQVEAARDDVGKVSRRLLSFEFRNAFYLAGRVGFTFSETKLLLNYAVIEPGDDWLSFMMWFEWGRGRFIQFILNVSIWSRKPFYATRSAENFRRSIVNGFHLDALIDPDLKGTEIEASTREHILKRVNTSNPTKEKKPDVLVVRYKPSTDPVVNESAKKLAKEAVRDSLFRLAGVNLHDKMKAYLAKAIIVTEPAQHLIKPSYVLNNARKAGLNIVLGGNVRFDFYTAMPEQVDMNDTLVQFIIYSLLPGIRVLPISKQVESARVISINA